MDALRSLVREVPGFPKPGILFYDITTLLKDPGGLAGVAEGLAEAASGLDAEIVAGIESRGFLMGPALALRLGTGFALMRKPGKLPADVASVEYDLEYGSDALEIHTDAVRPGQRVLIVDDLLATGGTAAAAATLVERLGGVVAGLLFIVELDFLAGRSKLERYAVSSLLHYDS